MHRPELALPETHGPFNRGHGAPEDLPNFCHSKTLLGLSKRIAGAAHRMSHSRAPIVQNRALLREEHDPSASQSCSLLRVTEDGPNDQEPIVVKLVGLCDVFRPGRPLQRVPCGNCNAPPCRSRTCGKGARWEAVQSSDFSRPRDHLHIAET